MEVEVEVHLGGRECGVVYGEGELQLLGRQGEQGGRRVRRQLGRVLGAGGASPGPLNPQVPKPLAP